MKKELCVVLVATLSIALLYRWSKGKKKAVKPEIKEVEATTNMYGDYEGFMYGE